MKQDYVIYKGKRYNSGDTINILWHTCGYRNAHEHTGTFIDCDEEKDEYRFVVDGMTYCFNKKCFYRIMYDKTTSENSRSSLNKAPKKITFKNELNIDGLLIAWIWYVFIMAIAIIFNDCIGIWILASVVFFNYRNKKLREAGYKK